MATAPRRLAFDPTFDYAAWRRELRDTLQKLIGEMPEPVPLDVRVETVTRGDGFDETRFVFRTEVDVEVPAHLLVPHRQDQRENTPLFPVVICLQGHSTGMHISLGRPLYEGDAESIAGDRDFALQAVREGYAALAIEQRCFGERRHQRSTEVTSFTHTCRHAAMEALLIGRTLIGERVWDVSRAIDALAAFPQVDIARVGCMGNSGGGTITYYAACLDERISIAMPSCAVCAYHDSIGRIDHCEDNYLPRALQYFDMGDLAGLIAPRSLVLVAGEHDPIFPLSGVKAAFATIHSIYRTAGNAHRCRLVIGPEGHRFYASESWPVFRALSGW